MVFQKISNDSPNSLTTALDFFTTPPTNTSISSSCWREYLSLNPLTDTPYHFKIYSSNNYLDLSKIFLLSELRIKKQDEHGNWTNIQDTDLIAPINFIGSTFINNIKVSLNGREISDSNSLYAYKTYLDTELSLPRGTKESYLSVAGYYTENIQENVDDEGFKKRKEIFKNSTTAQFIAKLDVDLFNQPNYLISGIEVGIEIVPNKADFCLLEPKRSNTIYKFEVVGLRLYVKSLELMSGLSYDISLKIDKTPVRYAIRRTSIKALMITENFSEFSALLWSEQVPRRVVLGMVSGDAYNGSKELSPFNFKHFNCREITLFANGRSYPSNLYNLNYARNQYARAFHDSCEALGLCNSLESNGIDYKKFKEGWNIYCYNLNNSGEQNPVFDLISEGSTTINIKFQQKLPEGIVLIAFAEFDSLIYIDSNRNVISDYNA